MPGLTRQNLTLSFSGGIDTKTDGKQLPSWQMAELENAVFTKLKQLTKRNGYSALPRQIYSSFSYGEIGQASALTSFKDELICIGKAESSSASQYLFSYSDGSDSWVEKGAFIPCSLSSHAVSKGASTKQSLCSAMSSGGIEVYAWEESGNIKYCAVDSSSKQLISAPATAASGAAKPMLLSVLGGVILYYINSSTLTLYAKVVSFSPSVSLGSAVQMTSSAPGSVDSLCQTASKQMYDVRFVSGNFGSRIYLAFLNDLSTLTCRSYDAAQPLVSFTQKVSLATATSVTCLGVSEDSSNFAVFYGRQDLSSLPAHSVYYIYSDALLTGAFSAEYNTAVRTDGPEYKSISSTFKSSDSTTVVFAYDSDGTAYDRTTSFTLGNLVGGFVFNSTVHRNLALASKTWYYQSNVFACCNYVSRTTGTAYPLQNQSLVIASTPGYTDIISRAFYGSAAAAPTSSLGGPVVLSGVSSPSSSSFSIPVLEATMLQTSVGDIQSTFGVSSMEIDFASSPVADNRSEIGGSLILGGGIVTQYDGQRNVELGFNVWPDRVTATLGAGGSLSAGQYSWVACYEWTDQQGYVHRSAASLPFTATATVNQLATFTVSALTITKKRSACGREDCKIVLYRTLANGTVYYRASSLSSPTSNMANTFNITLTDGLSDADLASRPQLYSTGGTVENIVYGPLKSLVSHRARLFGIDSINPLTIWFSKQITPNAPVEFSDSFSLMVDNRGGDITALASLDDKLIVFKKSLIMMISGQGPDALGGQNDFSDAMLVTSDCGCIDAKSIVTVPDGIMFQTSKGIYLLDRSLKAEYIGANVERYNSESIVSSQLIPTTNQVRFVTSSGTALVYDYYIKQWSTFTNHSAVDTVVWKDKFCYLRSNGTVMIEDPDRHDDDGSYVQMKATTSWIDFSTDAGQYIAAAETRMPMTLQGFQRAYKVMILGEYINAHKLKVQVSYDFNDVVTQETVVQAPQMVDIASYGSSSPYGNESPYGGEWQLYQWRIDLARQKCQSVKISISDVQEGEVLGESVRLSALAFDLGLKPGMNRVPMSSVLG